jgi:hypothetical protein
MSLFNVYLFSKAYVFYTDVLRLLYFILHIMTSCCEAVVS